MSDPSTLLPPPLLAHVHLLSAYKYPFAPTQLQLDTVLEYLSKAPALVRELAPVAWTYLGGGLPLDGSVLLVWRGGRCAGMCASDGYIWAEPELHFVNEVRGYVSLPLTAQVTSANLVGTIESGLTHRRPLKSTSTNLALQHRNNSQPTVAYGTA